jgi:hypothetical protein
MKNLLNRELFLSRLSRAMAGWALGLVRPAKTAGLRIWDLCQWSLADFLHGAGTIK